MISHEHRTIFIHIPKTAGTSVEKKLGHFEVLSSGVQDHRSVRSIRPLSLFRHSRYLFDASLLRDERLSRKTMLREMLGLPMQPQKSGRRATEEEFATYFKFTIVRNPWARVYSWYQNVMRDPQHGVQPCDFSSFLINYEGNWALRPQTYWITDFDGSIPLDRIVFFENLSEEIAEVLADLGFSSVTLPHLLNGQTGSDYRSAYDETSAALVRKRYCDEIGLFGYKF